MKQEEMIYIKPPMIDNRFLAIVSTSVCRKEKKVLEESINTLSKLGFNVLGGDYVYKETHDSKENYIERAVLINEMFKDKDIGAMIASTGGSGARNILEYLDLEAIKNNPKIFCGYSDTTIVLVYLNQKAGLVVFHGPSLTGGFSEPDPFTQDYFKRIFCGDKYPLKINLDSFQSWKKGIATGKVLGGNLARLVLYMEHHPIDFKDKIIFLEDRYVTAHTIKNNISELNHKNAFDNVKAVLLGRFIDLEKDEIEEIKSQLLEILKDKDIPILYGFKSGHGLERIPLPFGIDITVDSIKKEVIYEESPLKE